MKSITTHRQAPPITIVPMESRLYYSPLAEVVVADSVAVALAEALSEEVVLVAEALEADSKLGFKQLK